MTHPLEKLLRLCVTIALIAVVIVRLYYEVSGNTESAVKLLIAFSFTYLIVVLPSLYLWMLNNHDVPDLR